MTDPCSCEVVCPHGDRCLGGHAYSPSRHWYPCDVCTPTRKTTFEELREDIRLRRTRNRE